jgi:hypothetical protein
MLIPLNLCFLFRSVSVCYSLRCMSTGVKCAKSEGYQPTRFQTCRGNADVVYRSDVPDLPDSRHLFGCLDGLDRPDVL